MKRKYKKQSLLDSTFTDAIDSMSTEELKEKIVSLAKQEREIYEKRDQDTKLQEVIAMLADLGGAYRDSLKYNKEQRRYVLQTMESRGQ